MTHPRNSPHERLQALTERIDAAIRDTAKLEQEYYTLSQIIIPKALEQANVYADTHPTDDEAVFISQLYAMHSWTQKIHRLFAAMRPEVGNGC